DNSSVLRQSRRPTRLNSIAVHQGENQVAHTTPTWQSSWDWFWTFFFTTDIDPSASLNVAPSERGRQLAVTVVALRKPITEVSIITPSGWLRTYAFDSTKSVLEPREDSDYDYDPEDEITPTQDRYWSFDEDLNLVDSSLANWRFYPSAIKPTGPLEQQIESFLKGLNTPDVPTSDTVNFVRIIVFSGHYNKETRKFTMGQSAMGQRLEYSWDQLARTLRKLPRDVVAIPILACCFAGEGLNEIFSQTEQRRLPPQVILLASSEAGQKSYASLGGGGDIFLNGFFEALDTVALHESCQSWDDFMRLIQNRMDDCRDMSQKPQNPVLMRNTDLSPCDVFYSLLGTNPCLVN
ncbi:hypothetical protein FRC12_019750, partial [Ceratobasidium sp. 428]